MTDSTAGSEPRTDAGKQLLSWLYLNGGAFRTEDRDRVEAAILAIEAEARSLAPESEGLREDGLKWRAAEAEGHVVTFDETGYGLTHPPSCRPDLIGCRVNQYLANRGYPEEEPGRYRVTLHKGHAEYVALSIPAPEPPRETEGLAADQRTPRPDYQPPLEDIKERDAQTAPVPVGKLPLGRAGTIYDHARQQVSDYHLDSDEVAMGDRHVLLDMLRAAARSVTPLEGLDRWPEIAKALFREIPTCTGCDLDHGWDEHVRAVVRDVLAATTERPAEPEDKP